MVGRDESQSWAVFAITSFVALLAALLYYAWVYKNGKKGTLRLPPGPRGLPLIGILPFLDPNLHHYFTKLSATYGPIIKVQLGSNTWVVVSSPSLAKEVLRDHDTIFANRFTLVSSSAITYNGADIAWAPYGPHWRMLRKVCVQEIMSNSRLDASYAVRRQETRQTVNNVYSKNGTPVNIGDQMFLTVINVLMRMLWGATLKGEEKRSLGAKFRQVVEEVVGTLSKPNVSDVFPVLAWFDFQGVERDVKRLMSWIDAFLDGVIEQHLKMKDDAENKDFLHFLLQITEQDDTKTPLTITHIKALLTDVVLAGTDTTSASAEWAMTELMQHPEIMKKAQEELQEVVGMNNAVEDSHMPRLHYLHAVVKEALRLHPVAPFLLPRCPSSSCAVGGYIVPKGARVFVNSWALHRDPENWENPLEFQPARFLNTTDNKWDFNGKDYRYIPFGSGRRICVGMPIAERMVSYVLASLLHSFEWRLPEGTKIDMTDKFGFVLKKKIPLFAIPTPRLSNPELYI